MYTQSEEKRQIIEAVKRQIVSEVDGMRRANAGMPVHGKRIVLPLAGRNVEIVYYPCGDPGAPLLLGFHGGGFLFGGNAMDDLMWDDLRTRLHVNVASVDYRMSPDYQWREALEDAYDCGIHLCTHAQEFSFDADRIYVYGGSAGANLAAALCIYARKRGGLPIRGQFLFYPFLDCAADPDQKGEGSLEGPIMYVFNELHCRPEEAENPLVSPVYAAREELEGLPEAILVMSDHDNLKWEGYRYARMLADAGVPTHVLGVPGMPHRFVENAFTDPQNPFLAFLGAEEQTMTTDGRMIRGAEAALDFLQKNIH